MNDVYKRQLQIQRMNLDFDWCGCGGRPKKKQRLMSRLARRRAKVAEQRLQQANQ